MFTVYAQTVGLSTKISGGIEAATCDYEYADDLDPEQDLVEPAGALVHGGGLWYFAVFAYESHRLTTSTKRRDLPVYADALTPTI